MRPQLRTSARLRSARAGLLVLLVFAACKDDEESGDPRYSSGHQSPFPTCDAIVKQCHPLDVGEGPIHDCHDLGHAARSDADCIPKKDDCLLRICLPAADAGAPDGSR